MALDESFGGACMSACRDPTRLNLSPFRGLAHLELLGCDLSTSAWLGADVLRLQLRSLACRDSLEELWHLLAPSADRPSPQGACKLPFPLPSPPSVPMFAQIPAQGAM